MTSDPNGLNGVNGVLYPKLSREGRTRESFGEWTPFTPFTPFGREPEPSRAFGRGHRRAMPCHAEAGTAPSHQPEAAPPSTHPAWLGGLGVTFYATD
jgi:hypothetical protein